MEQLKARFPDPRIDWLGLTESRDFYQSIDVSIVPSLWFDPLPYVTIESLFAGKSLICARSGGIPEIAALGKVVEVFPAGDTTALAAIMGRAIEEKTRWRQGGFLNPQSALLFADSTVAASYETSYCCGPNGAA